MIVLCNRIGIYFIMPRNSLNEIILLNMIDQEGIRELLSGFFCLSGRFSRFILYLRLSFCFKLVDCVCLKRF